MTPKQPISDNSPFSQSAFPTSMTDYAILYFPLSQYTRSPLDQGDSVTGSGCSPPPETPASTANHSHSGAHLFSEEPMNKRTKEIKIRLTEPEHQRLLDRCDRIHLAEWLRQLGLGEHTSRKRRIPDVAPVLLRQVSGIGNNLNQIARRLNQTDTLPPSERVSLLSILNSLDRQLSELLEQHRDR